MDTTTIAVDLAKDVFEVATQHQPGQVSRRQRLSRRQFEGFLAALPKGTSVIMEACGTAHYWGRECQRLGLQPTLLPAQYVRAYVRRNKSDRTDADALLEARRCGDIAPVPVKTAAQQALRGLHRVRQQWQTTRTARINTIRGLLREQGFPLRVGRTHVQRTVPALLDQEVVQLPRLLVVAIRALLEELQAVEQRIHTIDQELRQLVATEPTLQRLQTIPGIGVIVSTGLYGGVPHIHAFRRGRHFASWLGLTPRESASGHRTWRGGISKRGDVYLRTMLTHGARAVLANAQRRSRASRVPLTPLQTWAVTLAARRGHNKATCALANKLARIVWAVWRSDREYLSHPVTSVV